MEPPEDTGSYGSQERFCPYIGLKNIIDNIEKDTPKIYDTLCVEIEKLDVASEDVMSKLIGLVADYAIASDSEMLGGAGAGNPGRSEPSAHLFVDRELDTNLTGVFEEIGDLREP